MYAEKSFFTKTLNRFRRRKTRPSDHHLPPNNVTLEHKGYRSHDRSRPVLPPPPKEPPPPLPPGRESVPSAPNGWRPTSPRSEPPRRQYKKYKAPPPPCSPDYNSNTRSKLHRKKKSPSPEPDYLQPRPRSADMRKYTPKQLGLDDPYLHYRPANGFAIDQNGYAINSASWELEDHTRTEPIENRINDDSYWNFILASQDLTAKNRRERTLQKEHDKKKKKRRSGETREKRHSAPIGGAIDAPDPYQINNYERQNNEAELDLDIGLFEPRSSHQTGNHEIFTLDTRL